MDHDGHLLDGVNSTGRLLGPPRFRLFQVDLNGVLLGLRQPKLSQPIGVGP